MRTSRWAHDQERPPRAGRLPPGSAAGRPHSPTGAGDVEPPPARSPTASPTTASAPPRISARAPSTTPSPTGSRCGRPGSDSGRGPPPAAVKRRLPAHGEPPFTCTPFADADSFAHANIRTAEGVPGCAMDDAIPTGRGPACSGRPSAEASESLPTTVHLNPSWRGLGSGASPRLREQRLHAGLAPAGLVIPQPAGSSCQPP